MKSIDNKMKLYAILKTKKDGDKEAEIIVSPYLVRGFFTRNLITCSRTPKQLKRYIKIFVYPPDKEKYRYSLINIRPLINKKIIKIKNLSDITD